MQRSTRFLWRTLKSPDFWVLVACGVCVYYVFLTMRRAKENIFWAAVEFAKQVI